MTHYRESEGADYCAATDHAWGPTASNAVGAGGGPRNHEDAALICAARDVLPALLDALEMAEAREARLRAALGHALVGLSVDWPHRPHPDEIAALKAVYAEPASDSALRALLAEARREGARAAWRSPSAVTVLENVERAAAGVGAAKEKP